MKSQKLRTSMISCDLISRLSVRTQHMHGADREPQVVVVCTIGGDADGSEAGVTVGDLLDRIYQLRDSYHPENFRSSTTWASQPMLIRPPTRDGSSSISFAGWRRRMRCSRSRSMSTTAHMRTVQVASARRGRACRNWTSTSRGSSASGGGTGRSRPHNRPRRRQMTRSEAIGLALWQEVSNATVKIRPRFDDQNLTERYLSRLARRPHVGWHPDFEARVQQLLGSVA